MKKRRTKRRSVSLKQRVSGTLTLLVLVPIVIGAALISFYYADSILALLPVFLGTVLVVGGGGALLYGAFRARHVAAGLLFGFHSLLRLRPAEPAGLKALAKRSVAQQERFLLTVLANEGYRQQTSVPENVHRHTVLVRNERAYTFVRMTPGAYGRVDHHALVVAHGARAEGTELLAVTLGGFTRRARLAARTRGIVLVDGAKVMKVVLRGVSVPYTTSDALTEQSVWMPERAKLTPVARAMGTMMQRECVNEDPVEPSAFERYWPGLCKR